MHELQLADLNWWSWQADRLPMGWFLLNFLALVVLLASALRRPLKQVVTERHQAIKRAVAAAAQAHAKASQAHADARHRLTTLTAELAALTQRSKSDGEAERAHLVAQAEQYRQRLIAEGEAQAGELLRRLRERLRRRLLLEAVSKATAALRGHLSPDVHAKLQQDGIAGVGSAANAPAGTKGGRP